jgi:hypothetical protein
MAGQPKTKARREREARSRVRFDRSARAAILKRADEIGAREAATEASIAVGTLRTWRKRAADAPEPVPASLPSEAESVAVGTRAERLRAAAEKARQASSRALESADSLLARSLASEARNASVVCGVHADRARELEESARLEEAHELALSEAQGRLVLALVERGYDDLGLPVPRAFVEALLRAWPGEVDAEVIEQARREIERPIRERVRVELVAEMEAARLAQRGLPAGDDASEVDDDAGQDEDAAETDAELVEEIEAHEEPDQRHGLPLEAFLDREDGPNALHMASRRRIEYERGQGPGPLAGWSPSRTAPMRASPSGAGPGGAV